MNAVFGVLLSQNFDYCELFVEAVDTTVYTDYLKTVKQPMCISTMLKKAKNGEYDSLSAFSQDMDLIGHNCKLYCAKTFPDMVAVSEKLMKLFRKQVEKASQVLCQIESSGYTQVEESEAEAETEVKPESDTSVSSRCKAQVKSEKNKAAAPKGEFLCMHCGNVFDTKEERSQHACGENDAAPKAKRIKVDTEARLPSIFDVKPEEEPQEEEPEPEPEPIPPIVEEVFCNGIANRGTKSEKPVRKEGTFTLRDGVATVVCHCCNVEMKAGQFELHAENRSKKAKNSIRLLRNGEQLCTVWNGRPRLVVQRSDENLTNRQRRHQNGSGAMTGKTFTVIVHNTAQAPQFILPCARGALYGASNAPTASGPLRGTKIDLEAIAASAPANRQRKLNAARHAVAEEIIVGDCVALETSDPWGEPKHRWWVARATRSVYTVVVPFTRGDNKFEVGDSVLDIKWFEIDDDGQQPNKKLNFVILPEVDTIFSYSVVSTKFPMESEQSEDGVTHTMHKSTWQALDRSVETQNHALKTKKRKA